MPDIKERPIIMQGSNVIATLEGRKTQTRRVVKPQPVLLNPKDPFWCMQGKGHFWPENGKPNQELATWWCPYGKPGDRLYVKEAWRTRKPLDIWSGKQIEEQAFSAGYSAPFAPMAYEADGTKRWWNELGIGMQNELGRYRHARFMPRWASRLSLEITGVRVERLQEISKADCIAEGMTGLEDTHAGWHESYAQLWESINGPDSWKLNPYVWVLEFKKVEGEKP